MIIAPLPLDEELRIRDLESYDILDTPYEDEFDGLVELASHICNCPISVITLLHKDRQWFKAKKGIDGDSGTRDASFCSHTILDTGVMTVEDALQDERFFDNPNVTSDPNVRFYAGAPIISAGGHNLGALCIVDNIPKKITPEQERMLVILSGQVSKLLELRKKNKSIREAAEELIELKTNTINRFMQGYEDDKRSIATDLHEDLAQRLAGTMLTLKMAEANEANRVSLLREAKQQVQDVIAGMRKLSYSITPPAVNWIPAEELLVEFINKTKSTYPFEIDIAVSGKSKACNPKLSLAAIRVIESWFKLLTDEREVKHVSVSVMPGEGFIFNVEDDNHSSDMEQRKKVVFDSLIYDRVKQFDGQVELPLSGNGKNILKVTLPENSPVLQ